MGDVRFLTGRGPGLIVPAMAKYLPLVFAALAGFPPLIALAAEDVPGASQAAPVAEIRTPPAPPEPRINGPRVQGARPGNPFFFHVPVTGEQPMRFTAQGLPAGLTLDAQTGNITGVVTEPGTHAIAVTATNARGTSQASIELKIGDAISLTPPLGWNSWNHFAGKVSAENVRAAADAMVASGLRDHGWTYINIDDCWQGKRDAAGNIQGNDKFPDLKGLGDYIHGKGLKFGLYSSPGPRTCAGFAASFQHEDQDARTYADWGVDYVKYDLCSYGSIIQEHLRGRTAALLPADRQAQYHALENERTELQRNHQRSPAEDARLKECNAQLDRLAAGADAATLRACNLEEQQMPYRHFRQSLDKVPRDIIYSLCQYGNAEVWAWGAGLGANSWRTTGDIGANWGSMSGIGFNQDRLATFAGPGHWNDPDMLEIGNPGLNPDECYTHMTLWCILAAPLLIGCDLAQMDPFTVSLFSNDEVLAVDQDALGQQGRRLKASGSAEVWAKPLADGSLAVALFNRGEQPAEVSASWAELATVYAPSAAAKPGAMPVVRDLWRQKDLPPQPAGIALAVAPHSAELLRVGSPGGAP